MASEIPSPALGLFSSRPNIFGAVHAVVLAIDEDAVQDYRDLGELGEIGLMDATLTRATALRMRWSTRTMELCLVGIDLITRAIAEEEVPAIVRRADGTWMHFPAALVELGRGRIARGLGGTSGSLYSRAGGSLVGFLRRRFPPPPDGHAIPWLSKVLRFVTTKIDPRFWMACVPAGQFGAFLLRHWPDSLAAQMFGAAPPEELIVRGVEHEPHFAAAALIAGRPRIVVDPWDRRPRWIWTPRRKCGPVQEYCRFRSSHVGAATSPPSPASAKPRAERGRARAPRRASRSSAVIAGNAFLEALKAHDLDPKLEVGEMIEVLCRDEPGRFQIVPRPSPRDLALCVDGKAIELQTCRNKVAAWRRSLGIDARRRGTQ